jgi:hypothetical protein
VTFEHVEYMGLAYGYPIGPARRVLGAPDSLYIETSSSCTEMTARIAVASPRPVGLRSIVLDSAVNAHIVKTDPAVVTGELFATVRVAPIDPTKDASGVLVVTDRTLNPTYIPYRYVAERFDIQPATGIDFGALTPKEPVRRDLVIANPVAKPLDVTSVRLTGALTGYTIVGTSPTLPATIPPGGSLRVTVEINPPADGRLYVDSVIVQTACSRASVPLVAETVKPLVEVSDVDFGTLGVGQSKRMPMRIANVGRGYVTFANDAGSLITWIEQKFWVDPLDIEKLRTARLGPDSSMNIMVTFLGGTVGVYRDEARVYASTRENRDISIWTATVVKPGPQIDGSVFGIRQVTSQNACTKNDSAEYTTVLPIYNTGSSAFQILDLKLVGPDADAGFFVKDSSDPAYTVTPYQMVRPAGGGDTPHAYQRILFRPSQERSYSATVRIVVINPLNNAIDSADALISGTGNESHVAISDLSFPQIDFLGAGATVQQGTIRLSALPTRPLSVSDIQIVPNTGEFVITGPAGYLRTYEPNSYVDLQIEFRPNGPGPRTAELRVLGDHATCDDSVAVLSGVTVKRDTVPPEQDTLGGIAVGYDFGTVNGCSDSTAYVSLVNTSTTAVRVTGITLESGSPEFVLSLPDLPVIVPVGGTLRIPALFTPAAEGSYSGSVRFEFALDDGGVDSVIAKSASLVGRSEKATATASIATGYRTFPGGSLHIPVTLETALDNAHVDDIVLDLRYAKGMMLASIDEAKLDALVTGTLLEGWTVKLLAHREDVAGSDRMLLSLRATAPAGTWVRGTGTLMNIDFTTFIGDTMQTALPFTIETPGRECTAVTTTAGAASLDSICGLSFRLIDATAQQYALRQNAPNPFNPSTAIEFAIGLDGETTLEIFNATGHKVATLVRTYLRPGAYTVTWDASSAPSGLYYYRLTSGMWTRTNAMILKK